MRVTMIHIREVRMFVGQRDVLMQMFMRFQRIPIEIVRVIVMLVVVGMRMRMRDRLVRVIMLMVFSQVQPDANRHQRRSGPEQRRRRLAQ